MWLFVVISLKSSAISPSPPVYLNFCPYQPRYLYHRPPITNLIIIYSALQTVLMTSATTCTLQPRRSTGYSTREIAPSVIVLLPRKGRPKTPPKHAQITWEMPTSERYQTGIYDILTLSSLLKGRGWDKELISLWHLITTEWSIVHLIDIFVSFSIFLSFLVYLNTYFPISRMSLEWACFVPLHLCCFIKRYLMSSLPKLHK